MADYIERDAAIEAFENGNRDVIALYNVDGYQFGFSLPNVRDLLQSVPAAEVVPVEHGHWEWLGPNRLVTDCMCGTCSVCKVRSKYIVNTMICPNCGAKMEINKE